MEERYGKIASQSPDNTVSMDGGTREKMIRKWMNDSKEAVESYDIPCQKGTRYREGQQQSQ